MYIADFIEEDAIFNGLHLGYFSSWKENEKAFCMQYQKMDVIDRKLVWKDQFYAEIYPVLTYLRNFEF